MRSARWIGSLLVAAGVVVSAYLLARTFALLAPDSPHGPDLCSVVFASSCDGSLSDVRAWVLGIPLAGWGLVYFGTLAALLALASFVAGEFEVQAAAAAWLLSIAGAVAGVVLMLRAWLGGTPICPLCASIHVTSLALVFVLPRAAARPVRQQLALVREAWTGLLRSSSPDPERARWPFVGFGCAALVALAAYQWVYVESALRRPPEAPVPDRDAAITAYAATPQSELPVVATDPHRGPLDAPVTLVVFESLQCPHCQRFAPVLRQLEHEFGDRLLVVFKHYPLSTRCNDRLSVDMQPDACEIAWAAEAAHRQSRFWQFHDAMLATREGVAASNIERAAHGAGLDPARFEADRRSAAVRERVAADVELGNRLKLPGTPAAYLDGRLVRPPTAGLLEILIRHELDHRTAGRAPPGRATRPPGRPEPGRATMAG